MISDAPSAKSTMQYLTFEVTTRCNLKCVMCPHGLPGGYPGQRDADDELIDGIVGSLDRLDVLRPTGVGEPLLSSGFWRLADALRGRDKPKMGFITNAILLTPANVRRLADVPLRSVMVSIDAVRSETHQRIRGNDLSRTLSGIKNLIDMRRATVKDFWLAMSFVIMRENHKEIPDFVDLAASMGAEIVYFEHLTPLMTNASNWAVERDGWQFNYGEQDMRNDPRAADAMMMEAVARADAHGIGLGGYHVFLDPSLEAAHIDRPSRKRFLAVQGVDSRSGEGG
jgi:MoaA/NifB/PqqE/SkfB family radical SAM enzyme